MPATFHDLTPSTGAGQRSGPARKPWPNLVCGVATLQLWPETEALHTPATLAAVRSGALAAAAPPSAGKAATWVCCWGAAGNCEALAAPGAAGGGSWPLVTVPAGAAGSGAGCVSIEERRELVQPAAVISATSDAASRPVFEKAIAVPPSGQFWGRPRAIDSSPLKRRSWQNFNPIWLK
ncbi:protein of unknown function [Aminobacter niigataensis]|nr:protein of unknown function [Aminobacter niigataensis]